MDLPASASDRSAHQGGSGEIRWLTPCGFTLLNLTAAGVFSTQPALAQCSLGIACGGPAAFSPIDRGDRPGQNSVVTSTTVAIEIPITSFGSASNTSSAPTAGLAALGAPSIVPVEHLTGRDDLGSAAATGAALLRLQPIIVDQTERASLSDAGSPTNLWNAEAILYRPDRTGGACSLNRQGPQINTCR